MHFAALARGWLLPPRREYFLGPAGFGFVANAFETFGYRHAGGWWGGVGLGLVRQGGRVGGWVGA